MFAYLMVCLAVSWQPAVASEDPVAQAKQDMHEGRYALVVDNLRQVLADRNDDYQAWFLFGVAHAHEQQYQQAIEAFRQVIALRPDLAEPHNNLAAVYNALGDPNAAVKELEQALGKRPDYPVAEENIANLYIELALRHYRSSLERSSNPALEQRYARLLSVRNPIGEKFEESPADKALEVMDPSKDSAVTPEQESTSPVKKVVAIADAPAKKQPASLMKQHQTPSPAAASKQDIDMGITGVLDALEAWRLAWSAQNITAYFAAYAADYEPESRFASINIWQKYKTRVITNKSFIEVSFEQVNVDFQAGSDVATVMMMQRFRSNSYSGDGFKRITFKRYNDGWKITHEASVQ